MTEEQSVEALTEEGVEKINEALDTKREVFEKVEDLIEDLNKEKVEDQPD